MVELLIVFGVFIWVFCGLLGAAITLAYYDRNFHQRTNREFAYLLSVFGPIHLYAALSLYGIKHGLKWW